MPRKHIKILLVEDDESNRLCLREFLEQEGFICHEAENGAEGLVKLQSKAFDVVITDLNMPNMNGFKLLDALANSPSLKRIPVPIVTGKSFPDEVKQKAPHPCVIDILPKPYDFPQNLSIARSPFLVSNV